VERGVNKRLIKWRGRDIDGGIVVDAIDEGARIFEPELPL
jgi:hypothetical protein